MSALNATDILSLIPHREPFLFVQHAEILNGTEIQGKAYWDATHPILQGHFPSQSIVPGVCQVEACAQLAGVLLAWNARHCVIRKPMLGVLGAIRQAKFQKLLLPDRPLDITCRLRTMRTDLYLVNAVGRDAGSLVLTCEFVLGIQKN